MGMEEEGDCTTYIVRVSVEFEYNSIDQWHSKHGRVGDGGGG